MTRLQLVSAIVVSLWLPSLSARAMHKDNGRNRHFASWQKQTPGNLDGLVVKLDRMLLEP